MRPNNLLKVDLDDLIKKNVIYIIINYTLKKIYIIHYYTLQGISDFFRENVTLMSFTLASGDIPFVISTIG